MAAVYPSHRFECDGLITVLICSGDFGRVVIFLDVYLQPITADFFISGKILLLIHRGRDNHIDS